MPLAVVAVGGNALIKDPSHQSVADQYSAAVETMKHIASMVRSGWEVVITHGNGPQVGFILMRSDLASRYAGLHCVPLDSCGADTQGAIGYIFQQVLRNEFIMNSMEKESVTLVTRVLVDEKDPAFGAPSKPIGPFLTLEEAEKRKTEDGWQVCEDAGRGWRRIVASPRPLEILEENAIRTLARAGFVVIAAGGGGIPVYRRPDGIIAGLEAVIDKDLTSALLASRVKADLLLISTSVERIYLDYSGPGKRPIDRAGLDEMRGFFKEGSFCSGSMGPKVEAAVTYIENTGGRAVITSPENITAAAEGNAGTQITP